MSRPGEKREDLFTSRVRSKRSEMDRASASDREGGEQIVVGANAFSLMRVKSYRSLANLRIMPSNASACFPMFIDASHQSGKTREYFRAMSASAFHIARVAREEYNVLEKYEALRDFPPVDLIFSSSGRIIRLRSSQITITRIFI